MCCQECFEEEKRALKYNTSVEDISDEVNGLDFDSITIEEAEEIAEPIYQDDKGEWRFGEKE